LMLVVYQAHPRTSSSSPSPNKRELRRARGSSSPMCKRRSTSPQLNQDLPLTTRHEPGRELFERAASSCCPGRDERLRSTFVQPGTRPAATSAALQASFTPPQQANDKPAGGLVADDDAADRRGGAAVHGHPGTSTESTIRLHR
jgi:hypothetical protein